MNWPLHLNKGKQMAIYRRLRIKALALGVLTDIGGSLLFAGVLGVVLGIYFGMQNLSANEITIRLQGLGFLIPSLLIGLAFVALGGYVAGRIAKAHEVLHGGVVGGLSLLIGLIFWSSIPLWYDIAGVLACIPCGMLGGRFATNSQHKAPDPGTPSAPKAGFER
jgi:hypothetical protein